MYNVSFGRPLKKENMKCMEIKSYFLTICILLSSTVLIGQQNNIAPLATVTASTCMTNVPCSIFSDLNFGSCGTQDVWIDTSNPPSSAEGVNYIEWNWPNPRAFDEIIIHHGYDDRRTLTGGLIQYWDGSAWVTHHHFSNLTQACSSGTTFPVLATDRMRITSFEMTAAGQTSNPSFREIEIIEAPDDAGITKVNTPSAPDCLNEDLYVTLETIAADVVTDLTIFWSVNGVLQDSVLWTGNLAGPGQTANPQFVGSYPFEQGDEIVVWTKDPNGLPDNYPFNDTVYHTVPQYEIVEAPDNLLLCKDSSIELSSEIDFARHNWSTGENTQYITVSEPGIYTVTTTDVFSECMQEYDIRVAGERELVVEESPVIGCDGETLPLETNLSSGDFLWSTGDMTPDIQVYDEGTYWVEVTDTTGKCTSSDTIEVEFIDKPTASFTGLIGYLTVEFENNSQNADNYFWQFGDGSNSQYESPSRAFPEGGEYTVMLVASNQCFADTAYNTYVVDRDNTTSINEISVQNGLINIYPNPATDVVHLEFNTSERLDENMNLDIFDASGRLVIQKQLSETSGDQVKQINVGELTKGVYLLKLNDGKNQYAVQQKLIIR